MPTLAASVAAAATGRVLGRPLLAMRKSQNANRESDQDLPSAKPRNLRDALMRRTRSRCRLPGTDLSSIWLKPKVNGKSFLFPSGQPKNSSTDALLAPEHDYDDESSDSQSGIDSSSRSTSYTDGSSGTESSGDHYTSPGKLKRAVTSIQVTPNRSPTQRVSNLHKCTCPLHSGRFGKRNPDGISSKTRKFTASSFNLSNAFEDHAYVFKQRYVAKGIAPPKNLEEEENKPFAWYRSPTARSIPEKAPDADKKKRLIDVVKKEAQDVANIWSEIVKPALKLASERNGSTEMNGAVASAVSPGKEERQKRNTGAAAIGATFGIMPTAIEETKGGDISSDRVSPTGLSDMYPLPETNPVLSVVSPQVQNQQQPTSHAMQYQGINPIPLSSTPEYRHGASIVAPLTPPNGLPSAPPKMASLNSGNQLATFPRNGLTPFEDTPLLESSAPEYATRRSTPRNSVRRRPPPRSPPLSTVRVSSSSSPAASATDPTTSISHYRVLNSQFARSHVSLRRELSDTRNANAELITANHSLHKELISTCNKYEKTAAENENLRNELEWIIQEMSEWEEMMAAEERFPGEIGNFGTSSDNEFGTECDDGDALSSDPVAEGEIFHRVKAVLDRLTEERYELLEEVERLRSERENANATEDEDFEGLNVFDENFESHTHLLDDDDRDEHELELSTDEMLHAIFEGAPDPEAANYNCF